MLPKHYRANPAEIVLSREEGRFFSGWLFSSLVYNLKDSRPSRFAFIVSTRLHKKSVQRNRVKRLLRAGVQQELEQIKLGKLVLFLVKKEILNKDSETVKREVAKMLKKAGLISDG